MGKNQRQFVTPWPFPVVAKGDKGGNKEIARAFLEVRRRYQHLLATRRWQQVTSFARLCSRKERGLLAEYYTVRDSLIKRHVFRRLIEAAGGSGSPRLPQLFGAFYAIKAQFELHESERIDVEALTELRTGGPLYAAAPNESNRNLRAVLVERVTDTLAWLDRNQRTFSNVVLAFGSNPSEIQPAILFVRSLSEEEQVVLCDPDNDTEVLTATVDGRTTDGPLSDDRLASDAQYGDQILEAMLDAHKTRTEAREYRQEISGYVFAPWNQMLDTATIGGYFLTAMATHQIANYRAALGSERDASLPWDPIFHRAFIDVYTDYAHFTFSLAVSSEFWYLVLFQILASTGGIDGDKLADWVTPLLIYTVEHPSRLRDFGGCQESARAVSAIKKHLAPHLKGYTRPDPIEPLHLSRMQDMSGRDVLNIVSQHFFIAAVRESPDGKPVFRRPDQPDIVWSLWETIVGPNAEAIPLQYARDIVGRPATDRSLVPFSSDFGEAEDVLDEETSAAVPEPPPALTTPPPSEPGITWIYVPSPGRSSAGHRAFRSGSADLAADMDDYFRAINVAKQIKTESIVSAMGHFASLPDNVVRLMPAEDVGGVRWAKMKRGALRILCRRTGVDEMCFHVYPRKEWSHDMFKR